MEKSEFTWNSLLGQDFLWADLLWMTLPWMTHMNVSSVNISPVNDSPVNISFVNDYLMNDFMWIYIIWMDLLWMALLWIYLMWMAPMWMALLIGLSVSSFMRFLDQVLNNLNPFKTNFISFTACPFKENFEWKNWNYYNFYSTLTSFKLIWRVLLGSLSLWTILTLATI